MRPIVTDVLMFRGLSKCVSMFVGHNRESESYKAAEPTEIKFGGVAMHIGATGRNSE